MPPYGPISRRELIQYLKQVGFGGPLAERHHQMMVRGTLRLAIPNPHEGDISVAFFTHPAPSRHWP